MGETRKMEQCGTEIDDPRQAVLIHLYRLFVEFLGEILKLAVDPKIVQDTLGHASLSMTLGVYSHVQAAMKDEAAAAMDSRFSSPG